MAITIGRHQWHFNGDICAIIWRCNGLDRHMVVMAPSAPLVPMVVRGSSDSMVTLVIHWRPMVTMAPFVDIDANRLLMLKMVI